MLLSFCNMHGDQPGLAVLSSNTSFDQVYAEAHMALLVLYNLPQRVDQVLSARGPVS